MFLLKKSGEQGMPDIQIRSLRVPFALRRRAQNPESSGKCGGVMREITGVEARSATHQAGTGAPPIALMQALDRIQCGVIITPSSLHPSFVNAQARQILDQRDGLFLSDRGLQASGAEDHKLLRDLIQSRAMHHLEHCVAMSVTRSDTRRAFTVYITGCSSVVEPVDQAILFICDANQSVAVDQPSLRALFGLTRAEGVLAELLMHGQSVETAADRLCISVNTARTHLKRILLKTDTGRQAELVRVLMRCSGYVKVD